MNAITQTLSRLFKRTPRPAQKRQIEAASGSYRWSGRLNGGDVRSQIHGGAAIVSTRAAHYALNNPHGAKIAQTMPDQLIGHGIKPIPYLTQQPCSGCCITFRLFFGHREIGDAHAKGPVR